MEHRADGLAWEHFRYLGNGSGREGSSCCSRSRLIPLTPPSLSPPPALRCLRCIHVSALLHARQLEENLCIYLPHYGGDELPNPSLGLQGEQDGRYSCISSFLPLFCLSLSYGLAAISVFSSYSFSLPLLVSRIPLLLRTVFSIVVKNACFLPPSIQPFLSNGVSISYHSIAFFWLLLWKIMHSLIIPSSLSLPSPVGHLGLLLRIGRQPSRVPGGRLPYHAYQ